MQQDSVDYLHFLFMLCGLVYRTPIIMSKCLSVAKIICTALFIVIIIFTKEKV